MDPTVSPAPTAPARNVAELRAAQNFPLAVAAGIAAAIAGAVLWAAITVETHMQIGIVSVGVGLLIGWAIREAGHGIDDKFRYLGALCAVFGCALGAVLVDVGLFAEYKQIPVTDALTHLNPQAIPALLKAFFKPMDLLFYAIAIYEAYKVSVKWKVRKKA